MIPRVDAAPAFLRERLARAALSEVRDRTWEAAFEELAAGYERALARAGSAASTRSRPVAA
jgi:hypothetical protein